MGWEPLPARREPVGLGDSLNGLRRLIGTARPDNLGVLEQHWQQVIGARLAAHCELHALRRGTLVVATTDGAVAEQLRWMHNDLVAAANSVIGAEEITSIEVRSVAS